MDGRFDDYDGHDPEEDLERADKDPERKETERIDCDSDSAAFILGKGGSTKHKIERVCNATIELDERANEITIHGNERERALARDYIGFVMQQRTGSVEIDLDAGRDDMTVIKVPEECVAFVMGRGGQTLRMMEAEWGTLMFFAKGFGGGGSASEMLMIFGPLRARRGAEMKVMSAVEHKIPGTFVRDGTLVMQARVRGDHSPDDWEVDTIMLEGDEFSYALGAGGSTRKKLAAASGCILEYVGKLACMSGFRTERRRVKLYLKWLLKQRHGPLTVNVEDRDDATSVSVPKESVGFITGTRGEALRFVERECGTFCFVNEAPPGSEEVPSLLIFSYDASARKRAKHMILDKIDEHRDMGGRSGQRYGGGGGPPPPRYDDRRGPPPPRYDDRRDRDYRDDRRDRDYNRDDRRDRDYNRDDRRDRDYDRDDRRDRDYNRDDRRDRDYDRDDRRDRDYNRR
jgi:predicted RNA-binding protein Jag